MERKSATEKKGNLAKTEVGKNGTPVSKGGKNATIERIAKIGKIEKIGFSALFFQNLRYLRRKVFKPYLRGFFMRMIIWYQKHLSKHTCLYKPTCSQYTLECINNHGVVLGILLGAWRILRCNPLSKGGYDPAPEKFSVRWLY